jgi:hypothetical protein
LLLCFGFGSEPGQRTTKKVYKNIGNGFEVEETWLPNTQVVIIDAYGVVPISC